MSVICLEELSSEEAEATVARIWRALEAHRIATPQMTVKHRGGMEIELFFASPGDAELVAAALRGTASARIEREHVG